MRVRVRVRVRVGVGVRVKLRWAELAKVNAAREAVEWVVVIHLAFCCGAARRGGSGRPEYLRRQIDVAVRDAWLGVGLGLGLGLCLGSGLGLGLEPCAMPG